jgi:membrane-associated phospholipid phosphatase
LSQLPTRFLATLFLGLTAALFPLAAWSQGKPFTRFLPAPVESEDAPPASNFHVEALRLEPSSPEDGAPNGDAAADSSQHKGLVKRSVERIGADQKRLYLAPFKAHNVKWDALVLVGTGAFLAADRRIENHLPGGHFTLYQDTSDVAVGGLAASLGAIWLYGAKTEHRHARETGELELETLINTFLIYTPMQLIAGRQRPGEGDGKGDFLKHHSVNTSFPGGHAMFTWAMASVLADEYPKPWARVLSYGAAFTVTFTRFMAQDHWASDMFLGSALGIAIAENTFHSHCDPQFESQCKHHQWWWKPMKTETQ